VHGSILHYLRVTAAYSYGVLLVVPFSRAKLIIFQETDTKKKQKETQSKHI